MWYTHSHCVYLNICYLHLNYTWKIRHQLFYVYQHTTSYADYWVFNSLNDSCLLDVKLHIFHVYRGREHVQQYIQKDDSEMRLPRFWNETTKTTTLYCLWKSINSIGTIKKKSLLMRLQYTCVFCWQSVTFQEIFTLHTRPPKWSTVRLSVLWIHKPPMGIPFPLHVDVLRSSVS
jgi:hypothetical protein